MSERVQVGRGTRAAGGAALPGRRSRRDGSAVLARPARKKAKAFFRLKAPASAPFLDDAPKAAQRRPPLALGTVSLEGRKRKKHLVRDDVSQQRLAQRRRQLRRRPRNGANAGLLSEKAL